LAREQIVSGTAAASALKLQLHAERFVLSTTAAPHLSFISCITPTEMQPSLGREYKINFEIPEAENSSASADGANIEIKRGKSSDGTRVVGGPAENNGLKWTNSPVVDLKYCQASVLCQLLFLILRRVGMLQQTDKLQK
jgi:hypothetical protein